MFEGVRISIPFPTSGSFKLVEIVPNQDVEFVADGGEPVWLNMLEEVANLLAVLAVEHS